MADKHNWVKSVYYTCKTRQTITYCSSSLSFQASKIRSTNLQLTNNCKTNRKKIRTPSVNKPYKYPHVYIRHCNLPSPAVFVLSKPRWCTFLLACEENCSTGTWRTDPAAPASSPIISALARHPHCWTRWSRLSVSWREVWCCPGADPEGRPSYRSASVWAAPAVNCGSLSVSSGSPSRCSELHAVCALSRLPRRTCWNCICFGNRILECWKQIIR